MLMLGGTFFSPYHTDKRLMQQSWHFKASTENQGQSCH